VLCTFKSTKRFRKIITSPRRSGNLSPNVKVVIALTEQSTDETNGNKDGDLVGLCVRCDHFLKNSIFSVRVHAGHI